PAVAGDNSWAHGSKLDLVEATTETTKPGADRVERLPLAFVDDSTEVWDAFNHIGKNGPCIVEHVEGMIIVDPRESLVIPQGATGDMHFDNAVEGKIV